jgi:hypothetical protein
VKVKNIEVNTKTHIHCAPEVSVESQNSDAVRIVTISGGEEKHLKAARILIDKMFEAFKGCPKIIGKHQGKGKGKGKGEKSFKNKESKSALPTKAASDPETKKKSRKFY